MQPVQTFLSDWPNAQFSLPILLSIHDGVLSRFSLTETFSYLSLYDLIAGIVDFHSKETLNSMVGHTRRRDMDTYYTIIYECCCKIESSRRDPFDQQQSSNGDVILRFIESVFESNASYLSTVIKQIGTYFGDNAHPAITKLQREIDAHIHSNEGSITTETISDYSVHAYNIQAETLWMPQQPTDDLSRMNVPLHSSPKSYVPSYPPASAYSTVNTSPLALSNQSLSLPPAPTTYRPTTTHSYPSQTGSSLYGASPYATTAPPAPSTSIASYSTLPYTTPAPAATSRYAPTSSYTPTPTQQYGTPMTAGLYSRYPSSPTVPVHYHTNPVPSLHSAAMNTSITSPYVPPRDTSLPTTYANAPVYSHRPSPPSAYPTQSHHNPYHSTQSYSHPQHAPPPQYSSHYAPTPTYPGPVGTSHRYPPAHHQQAPYNNNHHNNSNPHNRNNFRSSGRNYYLRNGIFDPIAFERLQPISRFLAHIRRQSMDVIFPQHLHDEVNIF
jgi:hypothetical protein